MPLQVKSLAEWEREGVPDMLSVVIPAHNEEGHIRSTVEGVVAALEEAGIHYEILVVNDTASTGPKRSSVISAVRILLCSASAANLRTASGLRYAVALPIFGARPLQSLWRTDQTRPLISSPSTISSRKGMIVYP